MLLRKIVLKNLLSFRDAELEMGALNVLIGPNASGKSNLIEAIGLLRAIPRDLEAAIRAGGGINEWAWKGDGGHFAKGIELDCLLVAPEGGLPMKPYSQLLLPSMLVGTINDICMRYLIRLMGVHQFFSVMEERLENEVSSDGNTPPDSYAHMQNGTGILNAIAIDKTSDVDRRLERRESNIQGSILAARRDPLQFPEITHYAQLFEKIALYRNWNMGRKAAPRLPQQTDLPNDILCEGAENLVHVLNRMDKDGSIDTIIAYMRRFYDRFDRLIFSIEGGTVQLFVREKGLSDAIPATRLSDGTLRLLSLLSVLCNRTTPPLICIEEPELGMHPDALPLIAEAMIEASERTQLIVTTHSEILIDALSDCPDAVVVCEHDAQQGTQFRRLNKEKLNEWLQDYTLGELWRKGEIGGKL